MLVSLPYRILAGRGIGDKVAETLKSMKLGRKCAVVCTEEIAHTVSGIIDEIGRSFDVKTFSPESIDKAYIEGLAKKIKNYDFVIGVGGGRNIDIAKYASHVAGREWIAFPTILSHDGVVSSRAIINNNGSKISVDAKEPVAIFADMDIIKAAPYKHLAAGAGDLVSNISAVRDWEIADKSGKEKYHTVMAKLSLLAADATILHAGDISKKDYHGLEILLWSLICSGFAMNIYGSSRPCSGSEHNVSHALEMLGSKALHGEQVALATIATTCLQGGDWKNIVNVLKKLKLPTTAKDLGVDRKLMIQALAKARDIRDRYTVLNQVRLDEKRAEEILAKVGII
jgi:glycerol-1-phosphate dehydrogenase [NAD(P)+]